MCWERWRVSVTDESRALLRERAAGVLHGKDAGGWTRASPLLYPHQWSWDSAFIAIGWAHLDVGRALFELEQLFAAQWPSGLVPQAWIRILRPFLRTRGGLHDSHGQERGCCSISVAGFVPRRCGVQQLHF